MRDLLAQYPGIEVGTSYGTPALKVRTKLIARLHEDGETLVLRCPATARDHLLQTSPSVFYLTDHYRAYPWVLVRLAAARAAQLQPLLEDAWRQVAGKRLAAMFDALS